jgi:hypothetical protein
MPIVERTKIASVEWAIRRVSSPLELPTLNPAYLTRPRRYTYAVVGQEKSAFLDGIMKFASDTKGTLFWYGHAQSPGSLSLLRIQRECKGCRRASQFALGWDDWEKPPTVLGCEGTH